MRPILANRRPQNRHCTVETAKKYAKPLLVLLTIVTVWSVVGRSSFGDPAFALLRQRRASDKAVFRVFGPASKQQGLSDSKQISLTWSTRSEQRHFLVEFGSICQRSFSKATDNLLLKAFDRLPSAYGTELWKYCVLYTGIGNVYVDREEMTPTIPWSDLLVPSANVAIVIEPRRMDTGDESRLHHGFLQVAKHKSKLTSSMMRVLVDSAVLDPLRFSEVLGMYVENDKKEWKLYRASCLWTGEHDRSSAGEDASLILAQPTRNLSRTRCPVGNGAPCCQVWRPEEPDETYPVMFLSNPFLTPTPSKQSAPRPYRDANTAEEMVMPVEDIPYIATVREIVHEAPAVTWRVPNFFDILAENNCLPEGKDCFKCLKTYKENHDNDDCERCKRECSCYCSVLCNIRPPPKRIAADWIVTPPVYRKVPHRLVPRIIHQTWYEPITKEKYPNMSRLIESFRKSGWEYNFYDDDTAGQFLSAHFPPQVREAYDAILPGAFKADLFRYCVLLIRGGVYADMDIMLSSNFDNVLDDSIGFLTAQDEPGLKQGHRSCLWNGLMASAPGHPFLVRTVETVVNNIRNRFTSLDYDDMLCPDPVLSVSHTTDMLFTCGPCILGASINDVLRRHKQTSFDYGDMDLFAVDREQVTPIAGDDLRLFIPGRSVLLRQDKNDMGAHRFTLEDENAVVASTDLPESDDRPKSLVHYSKTHERYGIYGLNKLYTDDQRANEEIRIRIEV